MSVTGRVNGLHHREASMKIDFSVGFGRHMSIKKVAEHAALLRPTASSR